MKFLIKTIGLRILLMNEEGPNSLSLFNQLSCNESSNLNVTKELQDKKTFIKRIIRTEFPSKHQKPKPLAIKALELNIQKILFGNSKHKGTFADILKTLEFKHKIPPINHIQKIKCGSLVYLSLKELEPNAKSRIYFKQKETLLTSQNFHISNRFSLFNPNSLHYSSCSRSPQRSMLMRNSFITDLKTNVTLNDSNCHLPMKEGNFEINHKKTIKKPINLKINFPQANAKANWHTSFPSLTTRTKVHPKKANNSQFKYSYIDKETKRRNKAKKEKRRLFNQLIYDKVNHLNNCRTLNERQLFEIIDKSQIREKPLNAVIRKDLEQIFDIQLKEANKKGETKKAIVQAMKLSAAKHLLLDETKARMIELSDRINKLTDEEALIYAERIAEQYHKNNKQLADETYTFYDIQELAEKRKSQRQQRLRIKLNENKITVLKNKILKENRKFHEHLNTK